MYKEDLALNNPQWLICHKTQPNQTNLFNIILLHLVKWVQVFLCNTNNPI